MISDEKLAEYKQLAHGTVMEFNAAALLASQVQAIIGQLVAEIERQRVPVEQPPSPPPPESAVALHAAGDFGDSDDEDEDEDENDEQDEEGERRRVSPSARKKAAPARKGSTARKRR